MKKYDCKNIGLSFDKTTAMRTWTIFLAILTGYSTNQLPSQNFLTDIMPTHYAFMDIL